LVCNYAHIVAGLGGWFGDGDKNNSSLSFIPYDPDFVKKKDVTNQSTFKFWFVGELYFAVGEGLAPPQRRKNIR
jgi:hypothetical protein